jgi:hypothetical protein
MRNILAAHVMRSVQIGVRDQEILRTAEVHSAIVVTSDTWFLKELFRFPFGHKNCWTKAGVILLPGEWDKAQRRLIDYLPVIEAVHRLNRARPGDQRVAIDLSQARIHIYDPFST